MLEGEPAAAPHQEDSHRNVVAFIGLTLDGVMQAPGRRDEDRRGGFDHGCWMLPYADAVQGASRSMDETKALLFGRRTYEDFFSVWPKRTDDSPFTDVLNRTQKYIASRTLEEPLPWANSTLLRGEAAETVAELRERPGKNLMVLGSGELVRSLMRRNLVDRYVLSIHPLILGSGRRLFDDPRLRVALELVDATPTTTGVVIAT